MKAVAVSQRVDWLAERGERRDALDDRLAKWLALAGFLPVPVPNLLCGHAGLASWLDRIAPEGLVLSGGNSIGTESHRDATERALLDHARNRQIPVLGICRGMQMLAVWSGATLKPVTGHVRTRHQIAGAISGQVNSYHDLALAECPPEFDVLARSSDGVIEAIAHRTRQWEGWMWHPEREVPFAEHDTNRLRKLFS